MELTKKLNRSMLYALVPLLMASFFSCEAIYEDLEPCETEFRVKFRYDRNMKNADAFSSEVESVNLWLFTPEGKLVWSGAGAGEELKTEDYAMTLPVVPGEYDMIAWCGLPQDETFALAADNVAAREDLMLSVRKKNDAAGDYMDAEMHRLYHGMQRVTLKEAEQGGWVDATLPLTKNTNVIRVMLQHLDGSAVNKEDFDFFIEATNGVMNYDNNILGSDKFTYRGWMKSTVSASFDKDNDASDREGDNSGLVRAETGNDGVQTEVNGLLAERTVGRLMADRRPALVVRRNTDDTDIIRIPLTDYLLMVKGNYNSHMTDQEYLDRQDDYTLTFFLDGDNKWYMGAGIYVNSWRVVPPQDTDF